MVSLGVEAQVLVWALIVFGALLGLLWKYAWGPIMHALEEREKHIQKTIDDAKAQFQAAEAKAAEYERRLHQARDEAAEIIAKGKRDVEKVHAEITAEADKEAGRVLERAKREILLAKQAAVEEIRQEAVTLTADIAVRVLQREINAEDHNRFVREAVEQITRS